MLSPFERASKRRADRNLLIDLARDKRELGAELLADAEDKVEALALLSLMPDDLAREVIEIVAEEEGAAKVVRMLAEKMG